jgi:5'-3' exonuclease
MDELKKQFIYISKNHIEDIKTLIRAYGATYYDAPGEADQLCASLVIKGKVWACLSEDMDMFVYGALRVIRYFSLLNHTAVLYDTKEILKKLGLTQNELRDICILSGTDYNYNNTINNENSPNLFKTLKYFKKYYKDKKKNGHFYDWLLENTDYIKDHESLQKINKLFELHNNEMLNNFSAIKIINGPIIEEDIKEILKKDGFIYALRK